MPNWIIVEDESDIHNVITAMFEIWGIGGIAFENGVEAIAWLEKSAGREEMPELALIDIRLPDIPGPEIGARLRARWGDQIAIVLITAYHLTSHEEAEVIQWAKADRLIYKPLPVMANLRAILERTIKKRNTSHSTNRTRK